MEIIMPIYEYHCSDCDFTFEVLRKYSEADAEIGCKKCHQRHVKRKISTFNATSNGKPIAGSNPSCSGCSGGDCSGCH
jgi:putative FmdB family regulatory protein